MPNRARIIGMFLLWALGFGMGFTVFSSRSSERIRTLRVQLAENEAEMILLRDRLSTEVSKETFSRASNRWLKAMTLNLAAQIHELVRNWREQAEQIIQSSHPGTAAVNAEQGQENARGQYLGEIEALRIQTTSEYHKRFQTRTVAAREELLKRLPANARDTAADAAYRDPSTAAEMETVGKDLERLAKSLP